MLEDSLQEAVTETTEYLLCRAFLFTCLPAVGDNKLFMKHEDWLLWGLERKKEGERRDEAHHICCWISD